MKIDQYLGEWRRKTVQNSPKYNISCMVQIKSINSNADIFLLAF